MNMNKTAIIIGAGPAGLTAAFELLEKTDIAPVIFEMTSDIGGISKTVNYKGNRIDIGGHRFFSKSDRVMSWWKNRLPIEKTASYNSTITYHNQARDIAKNLSDGSNANETDKVMLIRSRLSRIYYLRRFFDYPISLSIKTITNLGLIRLIAIMFSYIKTSIFQRKNENTLEDYLINRFGKVLYKTFFLDYTEKVWGVPCHQISAEWGAQRIKGLSIRKTIWHALKKPFQNRKDIKQKSTETSLIEQFLYPKYGPGQMWEETARQIQKKGGTLYLNHRVTNVHIHNNKVTHITVYDEQTDTEKMIIGDYFFSTMPVKTLIASIQGDPVPSQVKTVASGLVYRDFITVGILLKKLHLTIAGKKNIQTSIKDNWIYIQERDVFVGRLQIYNNWSPYIVNEMENIWLGMEYFCTEGDLLWNKTDQQLIELGISELETLQFIKNHDVIDSTIIRMPKTYPAYFETYNQFYKIREYTDNIKNLFLIGRNGMHKYNNQDHSMLTAMEAVDHIIYKKNNKDDIWNVNTENYYHEKNKTIT